MEFAVAVELNLIVLIEIGEGEDEIGDMGGRRR